MFILATILWRRRGVGNNYTEMVVWYKNIKNRNSILLLFQLQIFIVAKFGLIQSFPKPGGFIIFLRTVAYYHYHGRVAQQVLTHFLDWQNRILVETTSRRYCLISNDYCSVKERNGAGWSGENGNACVKEEEWKCFISFDDAYTILIHFVGLLLFLCAGEMQS